MNNTENSVLVTNETTKAASPPRGEPPPIGYYGDTRVMIWKVIPPIIISIGTFGNILTMIVLRRQVNRLSSTAMFLLALAVPDTVVLWNGLFREWYREMWKVDIRTLSDVSCKSQLYLTYVSMHMSSWLLVAVTMERVLSVTIPNRVKLICTPTKAGIFIVVITVLVFAIDIILPILFDLDGYLNHTKCTPTTKEYLACMEDYFVWINFCIAYGGPFIILLMGNILIMVKLAKSHSNRVKMNATRGQTNSARKERSVTMLLVSLCFIFFLTMSPISIYHIWWPYRLKEIFTMADPYELFDAYQYLLFQKAVVSIVAYTNASINFLLYVFNGSKFRGELKALFYCKTSTRNSVFESRSRPSPTPNTNAYTIKSYANVSNQSANKSSVVNAASVRSCS